MHKALLVTLAILIVLPFATPLVSAATQPPTVEKKYQGLWQKITLRDLLRKEAVKGAAITPTSTPTPRIKSVQKITAPATDVTSSIMKALNDYRSSQGLGAVQTSNETCAFAKLRAQEITTNFNHDGFAKRRDNKTMPYAKWSAITENIAMTSNYGDVVTMWKNSSGHAANMRADTPFVCVMQNGNYYAYEGMKP
jgi:uncharacterized protein YkwD